MIYVDPRNVQIGYSEIKFSAPLPLLLIRIKPNGDYFNNDTKIKLKFPLSLSSGTILISAEKKLLKQQFELLFRPTKTLHGWRVEPASVKRLLSLVLPTKNTRWKVRHSDKQ